jgi:acyl dehydratase
VEVTESKSSSRTARPARALDEATIEAVRRRIGIPARRSRRQHNEVSSSDSFRHYANAYGDDNPLYCEPDHARASSWGSPIAPPLYPMSAGILRAVEWSEAEKAAMSGGDPLAGIGQYMCGERWVLLRPVRAGDLLMRSQCLSSAELRTSRFGGGTGALVSHQIRWESEDGSPVAFRFLDYWHADREKSQKAGKYRGIERTSYTDADIERIDALYAAETVRGAKPRLARDVESGDALGPIAKGPMSVTDVVCWHTGLGMGEYGVSALKLGYENRQRVPGFYQRNELGFWDAAQRCHWDQAWAERLGHPAPYDYGFMRTNWMAHLLTNWMGDDGWIWKLTASVRKFNYLGDVHLVSGVVKEVDRVASTVTIDLRAENQRGETTCDGRAVVLLPPPGGGSVALPEFREEDVPEAIAP